MCLALIAVNSALQSALYNLSLHKHHHQSEIQDSRETIKPIGPQKLPHITYCMWPPCGHLLLQHATTLLHNSLLQLRAKLFFYHSLMPELLPSLPSNFIAHTIYATPLFSNFHLVVLCHTATYTIPVCYTPLPRYHCTLGSHAVTLHDGFRSLLFLHYLSSGYVCIYGLTPPSYPTLHQECQTAYRTSDCFQSW